MNINMTLSHNDLKLAIVGGMDKKIVRSIFSNILISSAVLVLILLLIFRVNNTSAVSTFLYSYIAAVSYNLLSSKYFKEEFESKNVRRVDKDFENLMSDTMKNPIIIKNNSNIVGQGERKKYTSEDVTDIDIEDFLNN